MVHPSACVCRVVFSALTANERGSGTKASQASTTTSGSWAATPWACGARPRSAECGWAGPSPATVPMRGRTSRKRPTFADEGNRRKDVNQQHFPPCNDKNLRWPSETREPRSAQASASLGERKTMLCSRATSNSIPVRPTVPAAAVFQDLWPDHRCAGQHWGERSTTACDELRNSASPLFQQPALLSGY